MSLASTTVTEPNCIITEENVKKALKADKGNGAFLKSWKAVDFTKGGDNFASKITSVNVKYSTLTDNDSDVTYVVKLNSQRTDTDLNEAEPFIFAKEAKFYEEIIPKLNEALALAGQEPLRYPKCFLVSLEEGNQQIYFEDLRTKGFKMFDVRRGMDQQHITLVISELARLHSASYLFTQKFLNGESPSSRYDCLVKDLLSLSPKSREFFLTWFDKGLAIGLQMLEKINGYETSVTWLKSLKSELESILTSGKESEKFNSICHGDIWNNNMLFRYDDKGSPVEVRLLDLQICCEASVASDLNDFLYTSVSGDVRKSNLDHIMSVYHMTSKKVIEGGGLPMYFTKQEILEEYRDKHKYGMVFAVVILPILLTDPEEIAKTSNPKFEDVLEDFGKTVVDNIKTNPIFKHRFLANFDELIEAGLIC